MYNIIMKTWTVKCEDGHEFDGDKNEWMDVTRHHFHKSKVRSLTLICDDQCIKMPENCWEYSQSTTGSCDFSGGAVEIEAHNAEAIFRTDNFTNGFAKLRVSVAEKTGDITITLEEAYQS